MSHNPRKLLCIVVVSFFIVIISSLVKIGPVIAEIYLLLLCFCFVVVDVVDDYDDAVVLAQTPSIQSLVKIGSVIHEMFL